MHINLRAGEKLYLNGAVLRADRKVSLELLNDATFLLEAHVMSPEKATTPLRQLYFIVQMMLMNPNECAGARRLFAANLAAMRSVYDEAAVQEVFDACEKQVGQDRFYDALRVLRAAFGRDDAVLATSASQKAA